MRSRPGARRCRADHPGIGIAVRVDAAGRSVTVRLEAPLELPLSIPGSQEAPKVAASSTAAVTVQTGD